MSLNTTPRTWVASEIVTATEMNTEVRDALTGIQAAWTSWTPSFTSGLTVGNGTLTGSYLRVGKTVTAGFRFVAGTTSSVGVALIQFPVQPATALYGFCSNVGHGNVYDSSVGSTTRQGAALMVNTTTAAGVGDFFFGTNSGQMNATTPFTWATSDVFSGTLTYQAA